MLHCACAPGQGPEHDDERAPRARRRQVRGDDARSPTSASHHIARAHRRGSARAVNGGIERTFLFDNGRLNPRSERRSRPNVSSLTPTRPATRARALVPKRPVSRANRTRAQTTTRRNRLATPTRGGAPEPFVFPGPLSPLHFVLIFLPPSTFVRLSVFPPLPSPPVALPPSPSPQCVFHVRLARAVSPSGLSRGRYRSAAVFSRALLFQRVRPRWVMNVSRAIRSRPSHISARPASRDLRSASRFRRASRLMLQPRRLGSCPDVRAM